MMGKDLDTFRQEISRSSDFVRRVDDVFGYMQRMGFSRMVYDYAPIKARCRGRVPVPSIFAQRNLDEGMWARWIDNDYLQKDPVQIAALATTVPFIWTYDAGVESAIRPLLTPDTQPVITYMTNLEAIVGITVPIHLPSGGFATLNGILSGSGALQYQKASRLVADFSLLAQLFNQSVLHLVDPADETDPLTPRELECLDYAANGCSAKEIACRLSRSEPTVIMHLNSAMRKLGARNRTHAVTLAHRRRLI